MLKQFEIEDQERERMVAEPLPASNECLFTHAGFLWLRVGGQVVRVVDVIAALDRLVDDAWIDPRANIDDELRSVNVEFSRTGRLPEKVT